VTEPVIAAVTVRLASVPTLVNEDAVTPELRVEPVSVPAAAVMVIGPVPSKLTPLIARAVCKAVAVAALPVVLPELPVIEPEIGLVTVSPVNVPTEVILVCAAPVTVAAEPVTEPAIGLVTVSPVNVPTEVILVCAAPVTVAAVPDTLPVTLPVNGPLKEVAATVPAPEISPEESITIDGVLKKSVKPVALAKLMPTILLELVLVAASKLIPLVVLELLVLVPLARVKSRALTALAPATELASVTVRACNLEALAVNEVSV
jgi:hypothetical protein